MTKFSEYFKLEKNQLELDFVDVFIDGDIPLFVDSYFISRRNDEWSINATEEIRCFFQKIIENINSNPKLCKYMLANLNEPNETRLGLSIGKPKGKGVSGKQANDLYNKLSKSKAVTTGFIQDISECELMVEGIGDDKISDMTINIIRKHLIDYTQEQCRTLNIQMYNVPSGLIWNKDIERWENRYVELPCINNQKLILVPKWIVVQTPTINSNEYYNNEILEYLQREHINANSSLVETLKSGEKRVTKKKLKEQAEYKFKKEFLYEMSNNHPELLEQYRNRKGSMSIKELWKIDNLEEIEKEIAQELKKNLQNIKSGIEDENLFQDYCIGALEFIFYPNFINPKKEDRIHDGRKRIDITYLNAANEGFFYNMRTAPNIMANKIVVECKNYNHDPKNPEIDQLSGRFSPSIGKFGIMMARSFDDRKLFIERCKDTLKDSRGLVIPIVDKDIINLLTMIEEQKREKIDGYLYNIYSEILEN